MTPQKPAHAQIGDPLTDGEREVLLLAANGGTTASIGRALHISAHAINSRLKLIYEKLGVHDRPHAVALALRLGIIDLAAVDASPYLAAMHQRAATAEACIAEARRTADQYLIPRHAAEAILAALGGSTLQGQR
jgi:DNA-binding CsgD family transcriptional regulator